MSGIVRALGLLLLLLLLLSTLVVTTRAQQAKKAAIHGITISTHGIGRDWGTDRIVSAIEAVKKVGANWIAIHPYARIHGKGQVSFRAFSKDQPPAMLVRPIREAHARGLKIFIKPHLAHWGSPFGWRGEIQFKKAQEWDRFFHDYEHWIVEIARTCKGADGFAVGTELDLTAGFQKRWRKIIAAVRKVTDSPLTYAANWTSYRDIGFWDALDIIGIQAYFPVADGLSPSEEEVRKGWAKVIAKLDRFGGKVGKDIVFTELGYDRSHAAASRPWEVRRDGPEAAPLQQCCLRVALQAVEKEPRVLGAFLWKWFPPPRPVGRDFALARPEIKRVIAGVWLPSAEKQAK